MLLTGSTGNLGKYLLADALKRADVDRIYCLDRSSDAQQIHLKSLHSSQLIESQIKSERLRFVTGRLNEPNLGLSQHVYSDLLAHVTTIIHNAWQVDFNVALSSLAPIHLTGTINLISLASDSKRNAHIVFHSSIAAVMNATSINAIKEEPMMDLSASAQSGYAESKLIAERLLTLAASTIPVTIIRIGQVAGPVHSAGLWPPQEWFPRLVVSAATTAAIPSSLGSLDPITWVPIDVLSPSLLDIALSEAPEPSSVPRVLHAVNPHSVEWSDLLPSVTGVLSRFSEDKDLEVVSFEEWLEKIRRSIELLFSMEETLSFNQQMKSNPAMKLMEFFEGCAVGRAREFGTSEAVKASKHMSSMEAVKAEWLDKWIEEVMAAR